MNEFLNFISLIEPIKLKTMKKLLLILAVCFTMVNCSTDKNKKKAKELAETELKSDAKNGLEFTKVDLDKIEEGDEYWDDEMSGTSATGLIFYTAKVHADVSSEAADNFPEGVEALRGDIVMVFETDEDGNVTRVLDTDDKNDSVEMKIDGKWVKMDDR